MRHIAPFLTGMSSTNRYLLGAAVLGSTPMEDMESPINMPMREDPLFLGVDATTVATAKMWQDSQDKARAAAEAPSGISIGGVCVLVGVLIAGAVTWPHVSRWLK